MWFNIGHVQQFLFYFIDEKKNCIINSFLILANLFFSITIINLQVCIMYIDM